MAKIKKSRWIPALMIVVLVLAYFSLPKYVQRALIYQKVGIDDYPIFENREVNNGSYQPWEVDSSFLSLSLDTAELKTFAGFQTIAYLIIKDNKIIFEQYWDGYSDSSLTNSFSMAKSIVGLAIGAAIDDGYIESVFQPVSDFIPKFKNTENQKLSIRDVLTMSSGLNWDESYGSLFNTTTEAYYGTDIRKLIYSLKVVETPGETFKYLSGNTELLAMVVESATGKKLSDYVSEKFWKPMGAKYSALWCLDKKNGMEKAYCCFNSNARDFARWGKLVLNNGVWNNDTLISPEYIIATTTPAAYLKDESGQAINYYGFQWWILHDQDEAIPYMRGILGQYVFVLKDENAVVVRLGHLRDEEKTEHQPNDAYLYVRTAKRIIKAYQNKSDNN